MASIPEILQELSTKEALTPTADIATALKSSKEAILRQLKREKEKGTVDGNTEEGWAITDSGRKFLEKHPPQVTMIGEGITPREKFESIGRLIGITEDRITLTADIVWSQNYEDLNWVWAALGQADIRDDLRKIWTNSWRAYLKKGIPPELEAELAGTPTTKAGEAEAPDAARTKATGRDYIIDDDLDLPVRVGPNLGDYSLQDAKDILAIRALRARGRVAPGTSQAGASQGGVGQEKLSDILNALKPYFPQGTDMNTIKEILGDKLALMRQEILSHIPQGGGGQPKTLLEQLTELRDLGPVLKSILGIPEPPTNPLSGLPVKVTGIDGQPAIMDLSQAIDLRKFLAEERRADERHGMLMKLGETARENIPDGIQAIIGAVKEEKAKGGTKTEAAPAQQVYECGQCHQRFSIPDVPFETVKCPNPNCGRVYTKEEITSA